MHRGDVKVFVALGGNFALAAPDLPYTFEALRKCELTVQVSTKLNRSHIVHGKRALILPCLGRTDKDHQASGEQGVTVEDSMAMVHISYGMKEPGSPQHRSECAILAGMAQATLPESKTPGRSTPTTTTASATRWRRRWRASRTSTPAPATRTASGSRSRRASESSRPRRAAPSSRRAPLPDDVDPGEGRLTLTTVRSHDQFNTTHLLERRPLPRPEGPAHRRLHERGRHA